MRINARVRRGRSWIIVLFIILIIGSVTAWWSYCATLPQDQFENAFTNDNSFVIWCAITARPSIMNWRSEQDGTWLHLAALLDRPRVAAVLIDKGACVDMLDGLGRSPLENAISRKSCNTAQVLLKNGVDATQYPRDMVHGFGKPTPLAHAAIEGNVRMVALLIDHGASIQAVSGTSKSTPLHQACHYTHYAVAKYFVDHGADVNVRDMRGMTPLMESVSHGRVSSVPIIKLLIAHGANVNEKNDAGVTALMLASMNGHPAPVEVVELLLDSGADISIKSPAGRTAIDIARRYGQKEVLAYYQGK